MPEIPIIDAHVHLYDPAQIKFDWMAGDNLLNRRHDLQDLTQRAEGVTVEGVVFIEVDAAPGQHLEEARWIEANFGNDPRLRGIVASMPLEEGDAVADDLAAFRALPHARGVRRLVQSHADQPGWAMQPGFVAGVRRLAEFDLPFDLCLVHTQLPEVIALVRACPEVRFVLDHIAKPAIRAGLFQPWADDLATLAREPNVSCKISGVATEADHASWTEAQLTPYIAHALHCFGWQRVMFGGDWPVSERAIRYAQWVGIVDRVTAGAAPEDLRLLYRDNVVGFYRL